MTEIHKDSTRKTMFTNLQFYEFFHLLALNLDFDKDMNQVDILWPIKVGNEQKFSKQEFLFKSGEIIWKIILPDKYSDLN